MTLHFTLRRGVAALALLAGMLGIGLLLAAPASAHATVVASTPTDGTRLKAAPKSVTIDFDEDVGLGSIGYLHVTDQTGSRVDARAAFHPGGDGTKVTDDLKAGLGDGTYTASFRVISADSHPVAGTIRFVVGHGALVRGSTSGTSGDEVTNGLFDAIRWITYAGLAVLGGAWLVLTVWPAGRDDRRARRIVWTGWIATTVGALLELLVQGPYTAGDSVAKIFDTTLIDATLHTNYGQLHSARLVVLGVLAIVLARSLQPDARRSWRDPLAGVLLIALAATISAGGHADTTSPRWLSIGVDMVHLLSMSVWIGGLVMLGVAVLPRREPDEVKTVVPVFSTVAFTAVVLLAASGTYSAWRGIGSWDAIFTTTYGLLVVSKIGLFLGIVAVANVSRQFVRRAAVGGWSVGQDGEAATPDAAGSDSEPSVDGASVDGATVDSDGSGGAPAAVLTRTRVDPRPSASVERLRRAVIVEAVIGLIVLVLSAVLVNEPRGREALAASYRKPVVASASLGGGKSVTVTADPGVHGPVNVTVNLDGATAESVSGTATEHAQEIGPLPIRLVREGGDTFDGTTTLPTSGAWEFDLVVTKSEFDATTVAVILHMH